MTRFFGAIILTLIMTTSTIAEGVASYDDAMDAFFADFLAGKTEKALSDLFDTNPLVKEQLGDALVNVEVELDKTRRISGEYQFAIKAGETKIQEEIIAVTHYIFFERMPIRAETVFFKSNDGWRVFNFQFDSNWNTQLLAMARQNILFGQKFEASASTFKAMKEIDISLGR